jgi:hypothetical protein
MFGRSKSEFGRVGIGLGIMSISVTGSSEVNDMLDSGSNSSSFVECSDGEAEDGKSAGGGSSAFSPPPNVNALPSRILVRENLILSPVGSS